jgi:hypothetical protein
MKVVAGKWKELSEEERKEWNEKAKQESEVRASCMFVV